MNDGSELHRLKDFDQSYDEALFNKLYRNMKPLMKRLAKQVDPKRFNVTSDIILSYFSDKFVYVFNKYQHVYDEEHLKAALLSSLSTFKNRLLRNAYTEAAEINQQISQLEDLYDDSKELIDDSYESEVKEKQLNILYNYMKDHLDPDTYLLFEIQMDPPEYIRERLKTENGRISALLLLDFFELPRTKKNSAWIGEMRQDIEYWLGRAKEDLKNTKIEEEIY